MKILMVATHGIGDVILTCQVVRKFDDSHDITFLVTGKAEKLVVDYVFKSNDKVQAISINEFAGTSLIRFFGLAYWIMQKKYDISFAQYGVSSPLYSLLTLIGGVKKRVGWSGVLSFLNSVSLEYTGKHKVIDTARWAPLVNHKELSYKDLSWDRNVKKNLNSKLVVIGPNAGEVEKHKRWPIEKYAVLCKKIVDNYDVIIEVIGSEEEMDYCDEIVSLSKNGKVKNMCGKYTISQSLERVSEALLVVSNCNAISHMAALADVNIIGIYGPTNPELTGPFSDKLKVVRNSLDCAPCYRRGYISGCGKPICIEDITVQQVYLKVKVILEFNS